MTCKRHGERSGVNTCSKCGEWLCEECSVEVNGKIVCRSCIEHAMDRTGGARVEGSGKRHVSWGLLFLFSFIFPGINYMYMGLMKRGLLTMSATLLCIYLGSEIGMPLFGLCVAVIWVSSIFDSFNIRRRINAGEYVADSVDDVMGFAKRNKTTIVIGGVVIFGLSTLQFLHSQFFIMMNSCGAMKHHPYMIDRMMTHGGRVVPLLVIVAGVVLVLKAIKGRKKEHKDQ